MQWWLGWWASYVDPKRTTVVKTQALWGSPEHEQIASNPSFNPDGIIVKVIHKGAELKDTPSWASISLGSWLPMHTFFWVPYPTLDVYKMVVSEKQQYDGTWIFDFGHQQLTKKEKERVIELIKENI